MSSGNFVPKTSSVSGMPTQLGKGNAGHSSTTSKKHEQQSNKLSNQTNAIGSAEKMPK